MASRHVLWLPLQGTDGQPCHTWWVWSWGCLTVPPKLS